MGGGTALAPAPRRSRGPGRGRPSRRGSGRRRPAPRVGHPTRGLAGQGSQDLLAHRVYVRSALAQVGVGEPAHWASTSARHPDGGHLPTPVASRAFTSASSSASASRTAAGVEVLLAFCRSRPRRPWRPGAPDLQAGAGIATGLDDHRRESRGRLRPIAGPPPAGSAGAASLTCAAPVAIPSNAGRRSAPPGRSAPTARPRRRGGVGLVDRQHGRRPGGARQPPGPEPDTRASTSS